VYIGEKIAGYFEAITRRKLLFVSGIIRLWIKT